MRERHIAGRALHFSSFQLILFGFMGVILLGALLLMLPLSSSAGTGTPFSDAVFTSTSAVCVTGLVVRDTARSWSVFGKIVILALIQIGGLGVVTMAVALTMFSGRRISLMQRSVLQESISANQVGGIVRLTQFILKVTFSIELTGAVVMYPVFCRDFGPVRGAGYALFHSVSAFCNAGFDLMGGREPFSSVTVYRSDPVINLTLMCLIIIGGIGFLVWQDIVRNGLHFHRYRLQTKAAVAASAVLILVPAVCFFFAEFADLPAGERFWASLFQSVTARTAGFNTENLDVLSDSGKMLMIVLMLIGGSPGSTAGGMKTTTVVLLLASAAAALTSRKDTILFRRRVQDSTVRRASAILTMYLLLFLLSAVIISRVEGIGLMTCMFETASAVGTVGLTLGITPRLGGLSRILLIFLMFFGRVGGLTIIYAALGTHPHLAEYPHEDMMVG
jgi:trk system potassium uptake protein TrkH